MQVVYVLRKRRQNYLIFFSYELRKQKEKKEKRKKRSEENL